MAAEKAILCLLIEELSEPNDIGLDIFLLLQNALNVTATAVATRTAENNLLESEAMWKLWFPLIVIRHLSRISG